MKDSGKIFSLSGWDGLWIVSVACVYFGAARLSLSLLFQPEGIAAVWPPTGIFLSAIMLTRRSARPLLVAVLFVTDLLAELLSGTPLPVSAVYAFALAGDAALSAWLLLRFAGNPPTFNNTREVAVFLLIAVVFSNALTSLLAAAASLMVPGTLSFWHSWKWWAASDGIGNLLTTPLIMSWAAWAKTRPKQWNPRRACERAVLFALLAGLNFLAFEYFADTRLFSLLLPYCTFPFLMWAALRFGMPGTTATLALVAVISVLFTVVGRVPGFSFNGSTLDAVIGVQLFLAIMAVPALFLAAAVKERRETGTELLESEARYRELFESNPHPMWVYDMETLRFLAVNDAAVAHYGYSRGEFMAMTIADIRPEEDVPLLKENIAALQGGLDRSGLWRHIKKDGTLIDVEITSHTIDFGGRKAEVVLADDVTERRRLQAQLLQSQKMESVGRLAGGVAHDFNNMLGVIIGHAELALDKVEKDAPLLSHLEEIQRAARRSSDLTRQLLAFARKQLVAPKVLDLNETLEGMLKMLRRLIGEDIDLAWMPGAKLWPLRMDPVQIDQMLANLCVNARDAIAGVGKVTIETENVTFDASYCAEHLDFMPGDYVMLAVSDDGRGMEREVLDKLFEPFFTTKEMGQGTGLGLATVYGIVKQNEGFINVYSEPGKGTTFRIYLPRVAGADVPPKAEESKEELIKGTETILLVEDEAKLLELGVRMLEILGYKVLASGTPGEALSLAESYDGEIHLLITDVVLPGLNGRELAERIRAARPEIRCLFMSGYTANVIAHRGVLDEGVQFLRKPFALNELAAKVREALEQ